MPGSPPRRPSTLAADKFRQAQRPIGASLLDHSAHRPAPASMMGTRAVHATGKPLRDVGGVAVPPAPRVTAARRTERDHVFVTSVVVAFILLTVAVIGVQVNGSVRNDRSRTAMTGTLTRVYEQQTAFRILNQRFATWPELEARGMALPTEQRVLASNASRSHWYMQLRDTSTGIVCSRTGELFDDSPFDRQPSCANGTP